MPSLSDVSANEYALISKSESDHQKIVAVFYDKRTHMELHKIEIGDNEKLYPTDCVTVVAKGLFFIALNKRTKSSEPHATEIHTYDLNTKQIIASNI